MFYLERLPVVLGTCLVIVACTGSTDEAEPEVAPPDEGEVALSQLQDDGLGDANPDVDTDAEVLSREGTTEDVTESDDQDAASEAYHRRCDRRNAWHCRRGHRGWRWVRIPHDGWHQGTRCCVRVRHPHHW